MWSVACILVYLCLKSILGVEELEYCHKVPNVSKIPKLSYSLSLINGVRLRLMLCRLLFSPQPWRSYSC